MPDDNEQLKIDELNDKYLRALAELENARKRAALDIENAARARAMSIAEQFLPLIDAIGKAAEIAPDDEGIKVLKKAADNAMSGVGIVGIETVGQMLNPQFHNAITTEESELPANTIIKEIQPGFMFGDTVLRAAMVAAAAPKKSDAENG